MTEKPYEQLRAEALHFWPTGRPPSPKYNPRSLVELRCERPIADDSLDHLEPRGTARDNTHWLPFVAKCEQLFSHRDVRYLDIGCAGGGLVFDFAARRHFAMGLEGSDYSLRHKRAEWATIPDNLYTCDVTRRFSIADRGTGQPFEFDVIGIWDVLEHLAEERLDVFFSNVRSHLSRDGLFCGTVSTREAMHSATTGRNHHETVQPKDWWLNAFATAGFKNVARPTFDFFDYPRGNGIIFPANFQEHPDEGFHFVLTSA